MKTSGAGKFLWQLKKEQDLLNLYTNKKDQRLFWAPFHSLTDRQTVKLKPVCQLLRNHIIFKFVDKIIKRNDAN